MWWIVARTFAVLLTDAVFAHAGPSDPSVRDVPRVPGSDIAAIGACLRQVGFVSAAG